MESHNEANIKVLRCKASTDVNKLAGSIHSIYQESSETQMAIRVIGAGALNQAVKASIICNKFFAKKGLAVALQPAFYDATESMTAIELRIILRRL